MTANTYTLNESRNITLTAYLQDESTIVHKRPAVIVIPGGGYNHLSWRESDPIAQAYLRIGYHAFILRYSIEPYEKWPNPLDDYECAMSFIRAHAEEWKIYSDKIAVVGFSAGGHLACAAATMSKNRPNAAILGYALTTEDVKKYSPSAPDLLPYVSEETCPCFLFATRTDTSVPVRNTILFTEQLIMHHVPFESHVYSFGPHGISTCDTVVQPKDKPLTTRARNWLQDSIQWLDEIFGEFEGDHMSAPAYDYTDL